MTVDEKIDAIGGYQDFYTHPLKRLGIPAIKMSDGPAGVRNYGKDTAYAAPVAMAATWDREIAKRVGESFGLDARARGVHVVLAPGVNIARVPMNGRNFEYLGEDPFLAAQMVVPYIQGMQSQGVIATVKHFAANNQEHGRSDWSMDVEPRVLREIYFPAFEAAVKKGGVWSVMCSYNLVNGTFASANHWLLTDVLKNDWGFKGFVMSDWGAVHSSIPVANSGLDLEMPGPEFLNRRAMKAALASGEVSQATIDDKVRRMLRAFISMDFLERDQKRADLPLQSPVGEQVVLDTAREGMVLLKNKGRILPLDAGKIHRIAVIGPNGSPAIWGGGGSSFTQPFEPLSVLDAIKARAGGNVEVTYSKGTEGIPAEVFRRSEFTTTDGKPGLTAEYFDNRTLSGTPKVTRVDSHIDWNWDGGPVDGIGHDNFSVRWTGKFTPAKTGDYEIDARGDDGFRVFVDGKSVIDEWRDQAVTDGHKVLHLNGGEAHTITCEYFQAAGDTEIHLGWRPLEGKALDEAVEMAKKADVVIMPVGFSSGTEGEGEDRTFAMPNGQDELIRRVAAANSRTIVVLNAGHAVETSAWIDRVSGLVHAWYPGQDGNRALAEIIFGDISPSGKLPISFDRNWSDSAAYGHYPGSEEKKQNTYAEGLFVGYRHYDEVNKQPLFPFGFGLSYTKFGYSDLHVEKAMDSKRAKVTFKIRNTGERNGAEIAQVYVHPVGAPVQRPKKELKGFARVDLKPGNSTEVTLELDPRAFSYWDEKRHDWVVAPGKYQILVGGSSQSLPLTATVEF